MKLVSLLILITMATGLGGCGKSAPASRSATPESMIAAAKALDLQFTTAFNKGDLDGVMATYSHGADVVLFPPDALEVRGWDSIRKGLGQVLASAPGAHIELIDPRYRAAGDVVIGWGTWRLVAQSPRGGAVETLGRYTDVKAEENGKWVYLVDHASVPLPPPEAEEAPLLQDEEIEPQELGQPDDMEQPDDTAQPDDLEQPDESDQSGEE